MGEPDTEVWIVENGDYWRAAWKRPDGTRGYKSLGNRAKLSKRQARVLGRRAAAEDLNGPAKPKGLPTLSQWLEQFAAGRDVGDATKASYRQAGLYLRVWFHDDPPIDQITRSDAAEWRDALATGKITDELRTRAAADEKWANPSRAEWGVPTGATVAKHVRVAKLAFGEAVDREMIPANPFSKLKGRPPPVVKDWRQVTADDMRRIIDACPHNGFKALFGLCRWSGLRLGEAKRLRWVDLDWAGNRMNVNATIDKVTTKRRPRVTPIEPARCPTGLTRLLRETLEAAPDGSALVCHGLPVNNLPVRTAVILKRSGVGVYAKPFHTLRKCCITDWAQQYPQHVVSDWVGQGIEVSQRHYLRVPEELYAMPESVSVKIGHGRPTDSGQRGARTVDGKVGNALKNKGGNAD